MVPLSAGAVVWGVVAGSGVVAGAGSLLVSASSWATVPGVLAVMVAKIVTWCMSLL